MSGIAPFPSFLVERYRIWREENFTPHQADYETLASGQNPDVMVISCCDSRVYVADILKARPGEFFVHRNIANLVPPFKLTDDYHGTSAAVEFGVRALEVKHLLVLGHAACGGVQNCHAQCSGEAVAADDYQFVKQWLNLMRPAFDGLDKAQNREAQVQAMAQQSILNSLDNLLTFPFVATAQMSGALTLHGAYHDIGRGILSVYNPQTKHFEEL